MKWGQNSSVDVGLWDATVEHLLFLPLIIQITCLFILLSQGLIISPRLTWKVWFSWCVSQGLWLQAQATTSTFSWIFNSPMFICYSYHLGKWKQLRCVCPHAHGHISTLLNPVPSPESHFYLYDSPSGLPMVKHLVIMRGNNNDDITVVWFTVVKKIDIY